MTIVACNICCNSFYVKPSHIKLGWGKYCSQGCRNISQRKGKEISCSSCGKKVYLAPARLIHSKSGKHFCSKKCQTVWRNSYFIREKHQNWTGGESVYRDILKLTQAPMVCYLCKIDNEKVLVAHHIDHNRKNNSADNLVWLCLNCHFLTHHDKDLDEKIREGKRLFE